ncbi:MAG TPA: hypothetical protein EYG88_03485 [Desulfocapsa sulfexigens]|nr:hypothetical protein [Desulfocapsa sulfexigens]
MEHFLDIVWEYLYAAILSTASTVNILLSPLQSLVGPAVILIMLAFFTVVLTKFLGKKCRTKRHIRLEEEFNHWLGVREEAMRCEDRDVGSRMARNIDQAKLNRCYYDYFLEGFLLSLATMYLPILMVMSYVNAFYRPEKLIDLTGKGYLFQVGSAGGHPFYIGSIFFYFVSLIFFYAGWAYLKRVIARRRQKNIINEINKQQTVIAG